MIEILQWSTLAVCGLVAMARIPSAVRGKNRTLFYIFALMTLAILLSIQAPYVAIDQALGGFNVANLILRLVIFAALFFVGIRITRGFGADTAYRLITGRIGMAALALTSLIVVGVFLMMDTAGSSVGLAGVSAKDSRNGLLVEYYGAAGRAYPAYVSLVLLPAMARACRKQAARVGPGRCLPAGRWLRSRGLDPVLPASTRRVGQGASSWSTTPRCFALSWGWR